MKFQRDELINYIYDFACNDKSIYFLSADFGAPALDKFRENLPRQFIHCGISEQHMIDLAVGLALEGNKVFCYAMAPFVSLRCLEQHKCGASIMKLPIMTIVAGVGFSYAFFCLVGLGGGGSGALAIKIEFSGENRGEFTNFHKNLTDFD